MKRKSILQHWEGRGFLPLPPKQERGSQRERNTQVALALFIASRNEYFYRYFRSLDPDKIGEDEKQMIQSASDTATAQAGHSAS